MLFRPLDQLATFETASQVGQTAAPTRYAIRQAMHQEYQKYLLRKNADVRQARFHAGGNADVDGLLHPDTTYGVETPLAEAKAKGAAVKRDFFGRVISEPLPVSGNGQDSGNEGGQRPVSKGGVEERKVWVSFHEGFSNAVRKPITLEELMNF